MEQSVCMSWPDARPIAHLLLNSSFTARATVVPRPSNKAPAKAGVMFLRIGFVLGSDWGFPLIYSTRRPGHGVGLRDRSSDRRHLVSSPSNHPARDGLSGWRLHHASISFVSADNRTSKPASIA